MKKIIILFIALQIFSSFLYSQDLERGTDEAQRLNERGVKFGEQKRYKEAVKELDSSIQLYNKRSSIVFHNKGYALELAGNYPEAIAAYEEAVKRNPNHVPSMARVGFLFYSTGEYEKAVEMGERVLKLDPLNKEVIKWLPDAFTMKLKKKGQDLVDKKLEDRMKAEQARRDAEKQRIEEEKRLEDLRPPIYFFGAYEGMIRTGYYYTGKNENEYNYIETRGAYGDFPQMFYLKFTPNKIVEIYSEFGNPYLGAIFPSLVIHSERLEAIFHVGNYSLGVGGMGNHYKSETDKEICRKGIKLNDYKLGFVFGAKKDKVVMKVSFYPRALLYDTSSSDGLTFDTDFVKMDYNFLIDEMLSIYSWGAIRDYYYFDHDLNISSYFGVYDFGIGVKLSMFDSDTERKLISVYLDYTARLYFADLFNDQPYKFANGQGWFGVNKDKWFKGDPFSGFYSTGHVISLKIEEWMNKYIFLFQKISVEFVDRIKGDHNEFIYTLGAGGIIF